MKTSVTTKIKDIKFGAKEDTITLTIDGNISDQQANILRAIKKTGVAFVSFSSSQLDIDDMRPADREGLSYTLNNGEVEVEDKDRQMSLDDVKLEGDADADRESQEEGDDLEGEGANDPMAGVGDEELENEDDGEKDEETETEPDPDVDEDKDEPDADLKDDF